MQLIANNISAKRGDDVLFHQLSFSLKEKQCLMIIGRNGVGKSTLLRIMAGFLPIEQGMMQFKDGTFTYAPNDSCHYLSTQNALKAHLTPMENLEFWANFDKDKNALSPQQALETVELDHLAHLPFAVLSTGQKRRVAIARLLLSHKALWLLDEPTNGLDSHAVIIFKNILAEYLSKGGMAIVATHTPIIDISQNIAANLIISLEDYVPHFAEL